MRFSILFLFVLVLAACEDKQGRLQRFLFLGNKAMAEQGFEDARYYFEEAVKLDPCFIDALNNLGTLHAKQKHFDEAVNFFNKAIECDQKFLPAYFNRANACYDSKQYFLMLKDAEYVLSVKPDTIVGLILQGLAQTKLKQYEAALRTFDRAIELNSSNAEHWTNRGTVKYFQKNWTGAQADMRKSLQLLPNQSNALNALGLLAIERNNLDSAKIFFQQALLIKNQEPYYLNNLGLIYLFEDKLDEARELINQSITLDPDNAWAYRNKGIYYLSIKDFASAERLLQQALKMDDSIDRIHFYYGQALQGNKKQQEACEQFKLSVKLSEGMVKNQMDQLCR